MYPPVLVTQPRMAKRLLQYRWRRLEAAQDYAADQGWAGARLVMMKMMMNFLLMMIMI